MAKKAQFRFYEELNDFLPSNKKKKVFLYEFEGNPSIKDAVESIGVPHTEIDLILSNGQSVGFSCRLKDRDFVSVYPVFESMDISNVTSLREKPLREPCFILDVHLGKLARELRMLGFDSLYKNDYNDLEIVRVAENEKRIILTRDIGILKIKRVTRGYWIRYRYPSKQLNEVIRRFDLYSNIRPFYRCMICNGIIKEIKKETIIDKLEPKTKLYYNEFYQCKSCKKVYWKGSHYFAIKDFIESLKKQQFLATL